MYSEKKKSIAQLDSAAVSNYWEQLKDVETLMNISAFDEINQILYALCKRDHFFVRWIGFVVISTRNLLFGWKLL